MLAFALTIQKGQRMALENVCIDCGGAFQSGQISVGIGRVKKVTFLIGANYGLMSSSPTQGRQFYGKPSEPLQDEKSCCQQHIQKFHPVPRVTTIAQMHPLRLTHAQKTTKKSAYHLLIADYLIPLMFITSSRTCTSPHPLTDMQNETNAILDHTDDPNFITWLEFMYKNLQEFTPKKPALQLKTKEMNYMIYQYFHQFPITQGYQHHMKMVFSTNKITEAHHSLG